MKIVEIFLLIANFVLIFLIYFYEIHIAIKHMLQMNNQQTLKKNKTDLN